MSKCLKTNDCIWYEACFLINDLRRSMKHLILVLILISCSPKDNIFYNGKSSVSNKIGDILPAIATPDLNILSPSSLELVGKNIVISGKCSNSEKIVIKSDDLTSDVETNCINNEYSKEITIDGSADKDIIVMVSAVNQSLSTLKTIDLKLRTETPTLSAHINLKESTKSSLKVDWLSSSSNTLSLKGYSLEYKKVTDANWTILDLTSSTEALIENLDSSTLYNLRVRAFNGNYSDYSSILASTKSSHSFFDQGNKALNLFGATKSALVAIEDGDFYLNGSLLVTLNKGEVHNFNSNIKDIISSTSAFYISGKKSTGNSGNKTANVAWTTKEATSSLFILNANRAANHNLSIYPFDSGIINVYKGQSLVHSVSAVKDTLLDLSLTSNGSYRIESEGVISAFLVSTNNRNDLQDSKIILPASTDQIGFPSRRAYVSSSKDNSSVKGSHSDGENELLSFTDSKLTKTIESNGNAYLYKGEALRLQSDVLFNASSYADSTGYNACSFVSRSMQKNTYAINAKSLWVAFASTSPGSITVTKPNGQVSTINLVKSGSGDIAVYKARVGTTDAGTVFKSTVPVAAWYEPKDNVYTSKDDETVLFGFNL